jgi:hypothetical protein
VVHAAENAFANATASAPRCPSTTGWPHLSQCRPTVSAVNCRRCRDTLWVCERHPHEPVDHGCGAPGMPCDLCQPDADGGRPDLPAGWKPYASVDDQPSKPWNALPLERGSVRNVTIAGDPVSYSCEVRTLPGSGLRPGDLVWVEFGSYWTEVQGEHAKQRGQWRRCKVLANGASTQAGVQVRLDDLPAVVPFG